MRTVFHHLESLPQPYRGEAMLYRDSKADNMFTCTIVAALMLALPRGTIRDAILKAYNRGEFEVKHVGQPEARGDMAMPSLAQLDEVANDEGESGEWESDGYAYTNSHETKDNFTDPCFC